MKSGEKRSFSIKMLLCLAVYAAMIILVGVLIFGSYSYAQCDPAVVTSFAINIAISFFALLNSVKNHSFSFDMMFWIFGFFFFGFAPLLQHLTDAYAWGLEPQLYEVLRTNVYVTLWFVFYIVGRLIRSKLGSGRRKKPKYKYVYTIRRNSLNLLLVATVLIAAFYLITIGFTNLFMRSTNTLEHMGKTADLLVNHAFRNTALFTMVMYILEAKKKRRISWKTVVAALCFLLSCFPTGMARYMMASFYVGLLIITWDPCRKGRWFSFVIIGGLVLIYPAINIFRTGSNFDYGILEYIQTNMRITYLTGDYDAHQMFISIQQYVDSIGGPTWGRQLLGVLLFFVPRSVWPTKPWGTGQTAFEALQQSDYTNVSAPLVSEAFVNFGIAGIIVFALVIGMVVYAVDERYWAKKNSKAWIRVVYPFLMLQFFFMCRGDLMSSGSYLFAQFVVGSCIYFFTIKKTRISNAETADK